MIKSLYILFLKFNLVSELNSKKNSLLNYFYIFHVISRVSNESPHSVASEVWLIELHKELEKQGISLPERWFDNLTSTKKNFKAMQIITS